jgi:hypothetical protein
VGHKAFLWARPPVGAATTGARVGRDLDGAGVDAAVTAIELGSGPDIEKSLREWLAISTTPHHRWWRSLARCGVDQRSEFRLVITAHLFAADPDVRTAAVMPA